MRMGGLITGVIGILIQPWKLAADPAGCIFTRLIGCSALLGAIAGVLPTDYFLINKTELSLADLYKLKGRYTYRNGINWIAGETA